MKLFYITPFIAGFGGVQRVLAIKTNYLIETWGYEIHILVTNSESEIPYFEFNPKVVFHFQKAKGQYLSYLLDFSKVLKLKINQINPDIIVVCDNGFKGYCLPLLLSKKHKIIFECHVTKYIILQEESLFDAIVNKTRWFFYDYCISKFTKCVVLVEEMKKEFTSKNTVIIPNPLWFSADKHASLHSKKVIAVGRHTYQKGFDNMLKIWKLVIEKHSDWMLEIYGEASSEINLLELVEKLNIKNNVIFQDPTPNIIEKYFEASFLILTSRQEGFGMVLIEAMATGLPCISYDCPVGPKDIITNNEDGFVIKNHQEKDFVKAIFSLIEDEDLRIEMGKKAKISSKKYNIEVIMKYWHELFISLK